jgi:hypothetical protein
VIHPERHFAHSIKIKTLNGWFNDGKRGFCLKPFMQIFIILEK